MATQSLLQVTYNLNTAGGINQPVPTDNYAFTLSAGTNIAGPMQVAVTSTPAAVPFSAIPTTAVYSLMVAHTGLSTDPAIILDPRNGAGSPNSSKISIAPGGRIYMHNVVVTAPAGTAANSTWANWQLSTASGSTTCTVSIVYT